MTRKLECYLDRFEGDTAVILVSGRQIDLPREFLPSEAIEGDYLLLEIGLDKAAREKTRQDIYRLKRELAADEGEE